MSLRSRRRVVRDRRRSRSKGRSPAHPRPLLVESLEQRVLLAGDLPAWQNPVLPEDVNADSVVAPNDVLLIVSELHKTGPRLLAAEPGIEAGAASPAEGEDAPPFFLDVNGDNYLTPADALLVARQLIAEGETELVQLRFEITDQSGASIGSVDVGDSFELQIFVQDIRPDSVPNRGVTSAFLDVFYDAPLISTSETITFGAQYSFWPDKPADVGIDVTGDGNTFVDQSILTVQDDQGRILNFEFDDDGDLSNVDNVQLAFDVGTTAPQMADAIVTAIGDQTIQGNFSALASRREARVSVENYQDISIGPGVQGLQLLIAELGNVVTDFGFGGPLGPGEFLFATVPFTADTAPIDAADDDRVRQARLHRQPAVEARLHRAHNRRRGGHPLPPMTRSSNDGRWSVVVRRHGSEASTVALETGSSLADAAYKGARTAYHRPLSCALNCPRKEPESDRTSEMDRSLDARVG